MLLTMEHKKNVPVQKDWRMIAETPLCSVEFQNSVKIIVWKKESETNSTTMAREQTLNYLKRALNNVNNESNNILLIANVKDMTTTFATVHLISWLQKLRESRNWSRISRCYVVADSAALLQLFFGMFTPEERVVFLSDMDEARRRVAAEVVT